MSASDRIRWFFASHITLVVVASGQMWRADVPWPGCVSSSTWLRCTSTVMSAFGVVSAAGSAAGSTAASAIVACVGSHSSRAGGKGAALLGRLVVGSSVLARCGEGQPSAALVACVLSVVDSASLVRCLALLPRLSRRQQHSALGGLEVTRIHGNYTARRRVAGAPGPRMSRRGDLRPRRTRPDGEPHAVDPE